MPGCVRTGLLALEDGGLGGDWCVVKYWMHVECRRHVIPEITNHAGPTVGLSGLNFAPHPPSLIKALVENRGAGRK